MRRLRGAPKPQPARAPRALLWCLAGALILRLVGIMWGLPHTYNADEPHIVNLAVSFGGGSLRPYAFKYPSLWPYFLAFCYGVYFLLWSGLGTRHTVLEFIGLYAWNPVGFYLIARAVSAALGTAALAVLWRAEKRERAWAPWLLCVSPALVEAAHSAKPDCAMFFFACLCWLFALRVLEGGDLKDHFLCGAFGGLSFSCQYTAAPLLGLPALAWALSEKRAKPAWLVGALACAAGAFLLTSPYAALDFPTFKGSIDDLLALKTLETRDRLHTLSLVLKNVMTFNGAGTGAALFCALGFALLWRAERRRLALLLALPALAYVVLLAGNPDGGWPRYLFGALPGLALLSAEGLAFADAAGRPLLTALLAVLVLVPGAVLTVKTDRVLRLPDTRALAEDWVEDNVPGGKTLLLDLPHAEPRLPMTREELEQLAARTEAAGSPRARLYRGMAATHPGGGYRILRLARTARDLYSEPKHVEQSQADAPMLDATPGLSAVRQAGVDYVITSDYGATPQRSPELARFFRELEEEGKMLVSFAPEPGSSSGPVLRVYRLK